MRLLLTARGVWSLAALGCLLWPQSGTAQTRESRARAHFESGRVYVEAQDYEAALHEFRAAYKLSPRPGLLYNIGLAAEHAGRPGEAAEAYEAFVAAGEAGERAAELRERIAALRAQAEAEQSQQEAEEAQAEAQPAPAQPEPTNEATAALAAAPDETNAGELEDRNDGMPPWVPWAVVGGGGALALTGGVLLAMGLSDVSAVEDAERGTRWDEVASQNDRAPTRTGLGIGLLVAGSAVAAGGLIWWSMSGDTEASPTDMALRLAPGAVALGGSF